MLYPFSLTLDLYIQAESFEEAKKLQVGKVRRAPVQGRRGLLCVA